MLGGEGLIGKHRKSSLAGGEQGEAAVWNEGNDAKVFEVKGRQVGIAICYESVLPATCAKLRRNGAEIEIASLFPSAAEGLDEIDAGEGAVALGLCEEPFLVERETL